MTPEEKTAAVIKLRDAILKHLKEEGPVTGNSMSELRDAIGLECSSELFGRAVGGLVKGKKIRYYRPKLIAPVGISASPGSEPRPMKIWVPESTS